MLGDSSRGEAHRLQAKGTVMLVAPSFRPDQVDAMHKALELARTRLRLTGAKSAPAAERVAVRIVELAGAGEFDPDKLTATVVAEFEV
jgi:hypothetical protein